MPPDDPFWSLTIVGDPGAEQIFNQAVYWRGGMTLHQLRWRSVMTFLPTGSDLGQVARRRQRHDGAGHRPGRADLGQDPGALFQTWLCTPTRPELSGAQGLGSYGVGTTGTHPGGSAGKTAERMGIADRLLPQ